MLDTSLTQVNTSVLALTWSGVCTNCVCTIDVCEKVFYNKTAATEHRSLFDIWLRAVCEQCKLQISSKWVHIWRWIGKVCFQSLPFFFSWTREHLPRSTPPTAPTSYTSKKKLVTTSFSGSTSCNTARRRKILTLLENAAKARLHNGIGHCLKNVCLLSWCFSYVDKLDHLVKLFRNYESHFFHFFWWGRVNLRLYVDVAGWTPISENTPSGTVCK